MTGEGFFILVIVMMVIIAVLVYLARKDRDRIKRAILERLKSMLEAGQHKPPGPEQSANPGGPGHLTAEEKSEAELERLQKLIQRRKQIAWETDISYHLWGFYQSLYRNTNPQALNHFVQEGEWYDVNVLESGSKNGLNQIEFELKGASYRFVDDEENQGWCENIKLFSLFLYDGEGSCLIEIPMKLRVDREGRNYSIATEGPKAFLPGDWIHDFIHVKLKQQQLRNQEIREQKHQEILSEIADLKERFGIRD